MDIVTGMGDRICRQSGAVAGQLTSQGAEFLIPGAREPQHWQGAVGQPCSVIGLAGQAGGRQHTSDGAAILLTPQGDQLLALGGRLALHYSATVHAATSYSATTDTATSANRPRLHGLIVESGHPGLANRNGQQETDERRLRAQHDARWVRRFWREPFTEVLADWYQQPVFAELDTAQRQQLIALRGQQDGRAIARMLAATSLARQPDHRAWLADSALPTLWLCGARDQKFSAQACQLARDCPRLATDQIAHAGHNVHRDAPEAMAARLQAWLRQQPLFSTFF